MRALCGAIITAGAFIGLLNVLASSVALHLSPYVAAALQTLLDRLDRFLARDMDDVQR